LFVEIANWLEQKRHKLRRYDSVKDKGHLYVGTELQFIDRKPSLENSDLYTAKRVRARCFAEIVPLNH
jgi:hypothetical protein